MARVTSFLVEMYDLLFQRYGPQGWWPADSRFEMMVGAVLTQSVAWTNVEQAIGNLKLARKLTPEMIRSMSQEELATLVYPSGYYNTKARKLKALAEYLGSQWGDDINAMARGEPAKLREDLLAVHGIGEETADDILLYALGKPVFVVDTFTRRLVDRLGLTPEKDQYISYQELFLEGVEPDAGTYGEYHALIVRHAKEVCLKTMPLCAGCVLLDACQTGRGEIQTKSHNS